MIATIQYSALRTQRTSRPTTWSLLVADDGPGQIEGRPPPVNLSTQFPYLTERRMTLHILRAGRDYSLCPSVPNSSLPCFRRAAFRSAVEQHNEQEKRNGKADHHANPDGTQSLENPTERLRLES